MTASVLVTTLFGALAAIPRAGGRHGEHNHLAVVEVCLLAVVFLAIVGAIVAKALVSSVHEGRAQRRRHRQLLHLVGCGFPWVPGFRWAHDEVTRLVELIADDAAARQCERQDLAAALVVLTADSRPVVPATAFAASGPAVAVRVKRLLESGQGLGRPAVAGSLLAFVLCLPCPCLPSHRPSPEPPTCSVTAHSSDAGKHGQVRWRLRWSSYAGKTISSWRFKEALAGHLWRSGRYKA